MVDTFKTFDQKTIFRNSVYILLCSIFTNNITCTCLAPKRRKPKKTFVRSRFCHFTF